jgi:8-oxo-dGTP pyrophosphatase MutT (NUDIX family)
MGVVISDDGKRVSAGDRFVPDLWNYELPGGLIEDDEAPEAAVAREILEETGFKAREIWHLATVEPMIGMVSRPPPRSPGPRGRADR